MTEAPDSFARAANPETEIGVEMCIRIGKGTIKLDMALPKDAASTLQFMGAVDVLSRKMADNPASSAKTAHAESDFGIKLKTVAGKDKTVLDLAISREAVEARQFMDAVAVLIGLKEAA